MSSDKDILRVPKLLKDGSNWVTYRDRLIWALDACGVLDHIELVVGKEGVDRCGGV